MLEINQTTLISPAQLRTVVDGMRNPKNSWDRSDSYNTYIEDGDILETADYEFFLGENDYDLMRVLAGGGPVHAKYRRMMPVWVTLTAPLYWWKEFDTYKVGTVANSCSTMHKIHAKEFTLGDFSCEHLGSYDPEKPFDNQEDEGTTIGTNGSMVFPIDILQDTIDCLNHNRLRFLETRDKKYWWQLIQLLPSSYNQKRTVMLNYEVLHNIYISRKDHKLDEWHTFCDWIKTLPYSDLITGETEDDN